ncbi:MAG TPA: dTDP-4-dehydrorhamnose 3,5-epimerase family protein [Longimicrobiales bacterium]
MNVETLAIPGVALARLEDHPDERGWFREVAREERFDASFVQANHSHSRAGVLRGLHYHRYQADAWYVLAGTARVGLADLREQKDRPRSLALELSADAPSLLFLPPGVAHGFLALTELDLLYLVTHYYDSTDEHSIAWNDPTLSVPWGTDRPILSERDRTAPPLDWERIGQKLGVAG